MSRFRTPSKGVGFPDAHDNCIIPNNSKDFWHVSNEALLSAITTQTEATSIVFFVTHRNVRTNCTFEFLYAVAWQTDRRSALYYTLRARKTPIRRFFLLVHCWRISGMSMNEASSFAAYTTWRCCIGEKKKLRRSYSYTRHRQVTHRDVCTATNDRLAALQDGNSF